MASNFYSKHYDVHLIEVVYDLNRPAPDHIFNPKVYSLHGFSLSIVSGRDRVYAGFREGRRPPVQGKTVGMYEGRESPMVVTPPHRHATTTAAVVDKVCARGCTRSK